MRAFMTLGAVVAIAGMASAQVWVEVGDAGENGIGDMPRSPMASVP